MIILLTSGKLKMRVIILLLLWSWGGWGYAQTVLYTFLGSLTTLESRFEQKLFTEKGELLETASGQMFLERPNKFHWDYQQPYQQLIVADGKQVWVYDKDLDQVTIRTLDKTLGKTPAFLLSRGQGIEEDFFVNALASRGEVVRFELVPKDAQAQFSLMRIGILNDSLHSLELVDNLHQTTVISFGQMVSGQQLDEGLFIFTPPAGADVIQEQE